MARPRADPEQVRRILIAVFEAIADHGVDGASMRRIGEATGLSTGTLNYHFGNKRGLLFAALDYAYRTPPDWQTHSKDAISALRRLMKGYVLRRADVRVWWRFWCAVTAHGANDPELGRRLRDNQRALVGFFADVIASGVSRGELAPELDPSFEAERLLALAHGAALRQLVDASPATIAAIERLFESEVGVLARVARSCESNPWPRRPSTR